MFNIGGGELIVILLLALIVLGPERLPGAARQVGRTMGELKRLSTGFQNEVRTALEDVDDPTRVAARRNVLAKETPPDASTDAATDAPAPPDAGAAANGAATAPTAPPARMAKRPTAQERLAAKEAAAARAAANGSPSAGTAPETSPRDTTPG
jgi:sec-independent protein translocase protein TatB